MLDFCGHLVGFGTISERPDPHARARAVFGIDPLGVGFQAGFFYGLYKKLSLEDCLKIGNFLAANIIRRIGAQSQVKISGIEFII